MLIKLYMAVAVKVAVCHVLAAPVSATLTSLPVLLVYTS